MNVHPGSRTVERNSSLLLIGKNIQVLPLGQYAGQTLTD
jgi:hypothetical protein